MTEGYWAGNFWGASYWANGYWAIYGGIVPPTPPTTEPGVIGHHVPRPTFPIYLLELIRDYLKAKRGELE